MLTIVFRRLAGAFLLLALAVAPAWAEPPELPVTGAEIRWDKWGVPHIAAATAEDAFHAMGWAQARGRGDLLLKLMGESRGRAAEYWGAEHLERDALFWKIGLPQKSGPIYEAQGPVFKARIDAFAQGVNDYLAAHPDAVSAERKRVLPITGRDVIAHSMRDFYLTFVAGNTVQRLRSQLSQARRQDTSAEAPERGSNAWAIAPSRSESGKAMLLSNPHLPWSDLFLFFEAQVTAPGMNAYGVTLIGNPVLAIAFNDHLGWTHTVNTYDGADIYAHDLAEGGYKVGDTVTPFEMDAVTLKVRRADGALAPRQIKIARTEAGPVVAEAGGKAYSLRIAGFGDPAYARTAEQYWAMGQARTLAEFEQAMAPLQMPMFNTIYADRAGDIFYLFNALAPQRARGDAALWNGVLDGNDPTLIWTDYHPYDVLPKIRNPASGFVQNANEPPWTATLPPALDPADHPVDFVPPSMQPRPEHSLRMLLSDESISFEEMIAYSHSTRLVSADSLVPDLVDAASALAEAENDVLLAEAAAVLEAWDRRADADSRGTILYEAFMRRYYQGYESVYAEPWSFKAPGRAPSGLKRPQAAVQALKEAATAVKAQFDALDTPWGELARIDHAGIDLPASLGPGWLGAFRVGGWARQDDGSYDITGGTTYVAATEFGETVRARAILPYGNFKSRPDWVEDQLQLLSDGVMRPVHFHHASVDAATVETETLNRE